MPLTCSASAAPSRSTGQGLSLGIGMGNGFVDTWILLQLASTDMWPGAATSLCISWTVLIIVPGLNTTPSSEILRTCMKKLLPWTELSMLATIILLWWPSRSPSTKTSVGCSPCLRFPILVALTVATDLGGMYTGSSLATLALNGGW